MITRSTWRTSKLVFEAVIFAAILWGMLVFLIGLLGTMV